MPCVNAKHLWIYIAKAIPTCIANISYKQANGKSLICIYFYKSIDLPDYNQVFYNYTNNVYIKFLVKRTKTANTNLHNKVFGTEGSAVPAIYF